MDDSPQDLTFGESRDADCFCNCVCAPPYKQSPPVAQGVKHSVDLVTFAGMHLDPTEYHGESLDEVEEATRAICNASWGSFEQLQLLVKSDCV
eukprot:SAG25_NODE_7066_length_508_cov_0.757946_1_plen_92_part_10